MLVLQVMPLVSALCQAATAHPRSEILLAHKHRNDATDLKLLQALSNAGFQVHRLDAKVHVNSCSSCSGEGESDQYTNLLKKFPSVSVFRLCLDRRSSEVNQ